MTLVNLYGVSESVNTDEAQGHLSELLERVALKEITLTRRDEPVAKLSPFVCEARTPGGAEDLNVLESFFEPLPGDFVKRSE